jgi:signal transduction histidine kinase/AraC-like DNA-binding protein/ABC-type sugar transport system substrate-binding protein
MTSHSPRIGFNISPSEPYWVQVREAVLQRAQELALDLIPINTEDYPQILSDEDQMALVEEILNQDFDVIIGWEFPHAPAHQIMQAGVPIIHTAETSFSHPLFVSPSGLYEAAHLLGTYLAERLGGQGDVIIIGGVLEGVSGDDGSSRIEGLTHAFQAFSAIHLQRLSSGWEYQQAYPHIYAISQEITGPIHAVVGLSDPLALAGRDVGLAQGWVEDWTMIAGINGDPLALAAIAQGDMTATVEISTTDLGYNMVDWAWQAAHRQPLPGHFLYRFQLVTAQNVAEVAAQKLISLANLPHRLVGLRRREQQKRLLQLETSIEISQQIGSILEQAQLSHEIVRLISTNYGYDQALIFLWREQEQALVLDQLDPSRAAPVSIPLSEAGALGQALQNNKTVYIPDARRSARFLPDPNWPDLISRVIVPIHLGHQIIGVLDLHSHRSRYTTRHELVGLQSLADQLGIAIRNAELYGEAVEARLRAEKAEQLKTRLLANVSHELRTPLNVILGYSAAAVATPNPYKTDLPPAVLRDFKQIYRSGEHLHRLINDLLDLSRAEIGELGLFPETIQARSFLEDVFRSMVDSLPAENKVAWCLQLPAQLPLIQADPVRLRQILLNLLSNAHKFTAHGQISLGAEVLPPHLHLWVQDTGEGIPIDLQNRIFEPFAASMQAKQRRQGVGLGLSITRRLVALHGGLLTLESQPGQGSTFHIYLPLPSLSGQITLMPSSAQPTLLVIAPGEETPASIVELSRRQNWAICQVRTGDDLAALMATIQPAALAWDLGRASLRDWTLIQQIRSLPQLCQLPFILYGDAPPTRPGSATGLTNFLVKPLGGETLLEMINAMRPPAVIGPVLIVEDDPQALTLYGNLAATALPGHIIRAVEGGRDALALMAEETPSLVILDLFMPEVDGFTVLEQMRTQPQLRRVPVVVISGKVLSFEDIRRLDYALVTFHSKDILSPDETSASLHRALTGIETLPQQTSIVVKLAIAYLNQNYHYAISRRELAATIGVSKDYLSHIFRQELGISPWEYLNRYRIKQAKALLLNSNESVTNIATQVGFNDLSYFNRVFLKHVGCSPRAFREQQP